MIDAYQKAAVSVSVLGVAITATIAGLMATVGDITPTILPMAAITIMGVAMRSRLVTYSGIAGWLIILLIS